jgi:hypothetical protein
MSPTAFNAEPMTETQPASTVFMDLIVAFLAPMFLAVSGGDIHYARAAATETVNAYRAESHADLLLVAQIVAFGLAALASLSLSMASDLPIALSLRLRGSAASSQRAGDQCRRARTQTRPEPAAQLASRRRDDDPFPDEATIIANVKAVREQARAAVAALQPQVAAVQPSPPATASPQAAAGAPPRPQPVSPPRPSAPPAPRPPAQPQPKQTSATEDHQHRAAWANAMANVAEEVAASIPHLPPAERKTASIRAAALSSAASDLLAGKEGQFPSPLNLRRPNHPA